MKATSKAGYGSGWHKQSLRHRSARLTGKAGGNYAYTIPSPPFKSANNLPVQVEGRLFIVPKKSYIRDDRQTKGKPIPVS